MSLEIYRKGQGSVARWIAYGIAGALVVFGAFRLYANINRPGRFVWVEDLPLLGSLSLFKVVAVAVCLLGFLAVHWALNRPKTTDLLIDTETEMRKVSWPSRAEVKNATIVVVVVTCILGIALFAFDWMLQQFFNLIFN